ncbi:hypothetical protein ACWGH8_24285 [Nonomuraea muscovyensis]|uniref:Uncharacterized protein n=1 Tax=Nonomuraea muscovyensis TaxID=1124761 RepID=A0A7X0F1S0_9ACTN|nr:hypothetical protein [Nonomuraea muscovyensis]MBB6349879.1 hypothetical protein [Nonomuraea muscovyensis]
MKSITALADRIVALVVPAGDAQAACTARCILDHTTCAGSICCAYFKCWRSDCSVYRRKQCA